MSHTPLPWKRSTFGQIKDVQDSKWMIGDDDAEFIVTACNAHYGLLEALDKIAALDGEAAKIASLALINARLV